MTPEFRDEIKFWKSVIDETDKNIESIVETEGSCTLNQISVNILPFLTFFSFRPRFGKHTREYGRNTGNSGYRLNGNAPVLMRTSNCS